MFTFSTELPAPNSQLYRFTTFFTARGGKPSPCSFASGFLAEELDFSTQCDHLGVVQFPFPRYVKTLEYSLPPRCCISSLNCRGHIYFLFFQLLVQT